MNHSGSVLLAVLYAAIVWGILAGLASWFGVLLYRAAQRQWPRGPGLPKCSDCGKEVEYTTVLWDGGEVCSECWYKFMGTILPKRFRRHTRVSSK